MLPVSRAIVFVITSFYISTATRVLTNRMESSNDSSAFPQSVKIDTTPRAQDVDVRSESSLIFQVPIGGPGGEPWDDSVNINSTDPHNHVKFTPHRRISEIHASCGDRPDSLQFIYRDNYNKVGVVSEVVKAGNIHGTVTKIESQKKVFKIDADDRITGVWLETCLVRHVFARRTHICYIKVETHKKKGDDAFKCGITRWRDDKGLELPATWKHTGTTLFAFTGRSGKGIDQLSSYWGNEDTYRL